MICVKYRKKNFYNNIKDYRFLIFLLIVDEMDFTIVEINMDLDYVHLLLNFKPWYYVLAIIKRL